MTRVFSCFLLLCAILGMSMLGCVCEHESVVAEEPLKFKNGVWVYTAPETKADAIALDSTDGTKTVFVDPDNNEWSLTTLQGLTANTLIEKGYTDAWFLTSANVGQRFFCQYIPAPSSPPDSMGDEPARCSVFLDAGHLYYAQLERYADEVPCPSVTSYQEWLPRVEAHIVPYSLP